VGGVSYWRQSCYFVLKWTPARWQNMREITTPKIHKCFDSVRHTFVRVKGHDDTKQSMRLVPAQLAPLLE
jgi:hypothetical protein